MTTLRKAEQFIEDMRRCRGIDFARIGMQVEVDGHIGMITGMNASGNLDVVFSNQQKWGKQSHNCHPTWEICYFDGTGNILADYRSVKKTSEAVQ